MKLADLLYKLPENAYICVYILDRDCEKDNQPRVLWKDLISCVYVSFIREKDNQPRVLWKGFVNEFPYFVEQQTHRNIVHRINTADTGAFLIYLI